MAFEEFMKHGVTEKTPKSIMLGAGTLHKGFKFGYVRMTKKPSDWDTNYANYYIGAKDPQTLEVSYVPVTAEQKDSANFSFDDPTKPGFFKKGWNFAESLIGATSGGNKVSIKPEVITVDVDGALVKVKGLDFKQGEVATLETNLVEITPELMKNTIIGEAVDSDVEGYALIESKADILEGDYFENLAFVGWRTDGTPIIIIFDNALCTTGFEPEAKNKENTVVKVTFECYQEVTGDLMKLPYHIYYPTQG